MTDAVLAAKATVTEPAGTVTLAGTVRLALLLESVTGSPPAGAGALNETVQVTPVPAAMVAGVHVREEGVGAVTLSMAVWDTPAEAAARATV